ncbi:coagulation factor XIII B chain [Dromaius novaehollandiae]|uniref:coagulation factor XIII B chain n=1 Tax=Dromaius novaehollandiae TaxID=8790 RepID=UPI00311F44E5
MEAVLKMRLKSWIFFLVTMSSGKLFAEDKPCDLPRIENGKIAQYYYNFKSYYFPMRKEKKLSYSCVAGYTTETGSQDGRITCTVKGWSPMPQCYKKCNKPLLENGIFYGTEVHFKLQEKLHYKCNPGFYAPSGGAEGTVQCSPGGWSSQPSCTKKMESCRVPNLHHGYYFTTQKELQVNETLLYKCDEGYRTAGGNTTEAAVCLTHGWSLTPNCTKTTYCSLSATEHGGFYPVKKIYDEGDVVHFFCEENYSLSESDLIQCYYFGWYPHPPICEDLRSKCPPPPLPPHAHITTVLRTYRNGDKVHIQCQSNFEMRGSEEIQCEKGKWTSPPLCIGTMDKWESEPPPSREADAAIRANKTHHSEDMEMQQNCTSPPAIRNGILLGPLLTRYKNGSSVEYSCQHYHFLDGPSTVYCVQGNWTQQPACLEPCTLDAIHMDRSNIELKWRQEELIFLHGDLIEFECKEGYHFPQTNISSPGRTQCNHGRLKYPKCIATAPMGKCGSPPPIENGALALPPLTEYDSGSAVQYSCSDYHFLQGSERIYCSEGQWTSPPVCIEPCTLSKNEMEKNNVVLERFYANQVYFYHGDFVGFYCKENHFGVESGGTLFQVQCERGQLMYPRCVERGKSSAGAACEDPPVIDFGEIASGDKSGYEENDSVQYRCNPGYTLSGSEWVTCHGKVWTPGPPQCLAPCTITKQQLEAKKLLLSRGRIRTFLIQSGQKLEFMCVTGYKLTGSSARKCVNGRVDLPSCVSDVTCEPPPEIAGGKVQGVKKSRYLLGEEAQYRCWQGFQMTGDSTVACQNGTWTELPKCRGRGEKCGPPPAIENGDLLSFPLQEYAPGSTVEYKCQSLYVLEGSRYITCTEGQWTTPPVCLVACTASEEDMNRNNIGLKWTATNKLYSRSGDFIEFQCKIGYVQDPASSPFRVQCVEGKLEYPHCKPGKECTVLEHDMAKNNIQLRSSTSSYLSSEYIYFECRSWWYRRTSSPEEFRVQCLDGVFKYPRCAKRGIQQRFRTKMAKEADVENYAKIKKAILCIQSAFRAKKARQSHKTTVAARRVQSFLQTSVQRKRFLAKKAAAVIIQSAFRCQRTKTRYKLMRSSAVVIQRWYRACHVARLQQAEYSVQRQAIIIIQSACRGMKARKMARDIRAARKIQSFLQMAVHRRRFVQLKTAAITLQAYYLMRKTKSEYARYKKAAVVLQQCYRSRLTVKYQRRAYLQTLKNVIIVQARVRGFIEKKRFHKIRESTIKIQAFFRGSTQRRQYLRYRSSVVLIQQRYRACQMRNVEQQRYHQMKTAAVRIQAAYRRFKAKEFADKMRAARVIQAWFRGCQARKEYASVKLQAARLIQTTYRGFRERRKLIQQKAAAVIIQKRLRAWQEGRLQSVKYNKTRRAVIRLQAFIRGYLVRRKYERTTQAVYEAENSIDTLLDLLQVYRGKAGDKTSEKGGSIFTKTCCLLAILSKDSERALEIRSIPRAVPCIQSLYKLTARKHKMDAERTLVKQKTNTCVSGTPFVPVTPVRTRTVSRERWELLMEAVLKMRLKSWIFFLVTMSSGKLFAEDKPCDLPRIENGKIAQYYYNFKSYYFPMRKEKKLSYSCVAGYTTETGSQDGRITCTVKGWSPMPQCYKKCNKPLLENGIFYGTEVHFKLQEKLHYKCNPGFYAPSGGAEGTVQCSPGGWSSQPSCTKKMESCRVPNLHHGYYFTTQKELQVNETLLYKCDEGYRTAGGNTTEAAVCLTHGWSLTPNCTKTTYCSLSATEHGGFYPVKKIYDEGDVVHFFCEENYSLSESDLIQCYYFGWYPHPPICEDLRSKCPPPPLPPHAHITTVLRTYRNGDKVHIQCQSNFEMRGSEEIQCEKGKWTSPPLCIGTMDKWESEPPPSREADAAIRANKTHHSEDMEMQQNCTSPPAIRNGILLGPLLTRYKNGSSVEYSCQHYHFLDGPSTVYCVQGNWTQQPACLEPCTLDAIHMDRSNIELKWRQEELIFLHGDLIEFECKEGYHFPQTNISSPGRTQCNHGRLKYPKCIATAPMGKCGSPPPIENGALALPPLTEYDSGSAVQYSCSDYHFLQGSERIYCSEGQWTSPPVCIEPCTLSKNEMEKNNVVLERFYANQVYFYHGDFVGFYCKENHFGVESGGTLFQVQCERGQLMYPRCVERGKSSAGAACEDPPVIDFGEIASGDKSGYEENDSVQYTCNPGYTLSGSEWVTCHGKVWTPGPPQCLAPCTITKQQLEAKKLLLSRGRIRTFLIQSGQKLEFMCVTGYKLTGSSARKCVNGRVDLPSCVSDASCGAPPEVPRASTASSQHERYLPGARVQYECETNFQIMGVNYVTCTNGQWSQAPTCREMPCGSIPKVANSQIEGRNKTMYEPGETVRYQCDPGFLTAGPPEIICRAGNWTTPPSCEDASCGAPPEVPRASTASSQHERYLPGARVQYECETNFQIMGVNYVTCTNGQWSQAPTCRGRGEKCGPPPAIENGDLLSFPLQEYAPGSTVEYKCQSLYVLEGSRYITCTEGQWTTPPVCLVACTASEEDMNRNNIGLKWTATNKLYSRSGDFIEFQCKIGYVQDPASSPFRVQCVEGKLEYPHCKPGSNLCHSGAPQNSLCLTDLSRRWALGAVRSGPSSPALCVNGDSSASI